MRQKDLNNVSRQKIILEGFKLFAKKTFNDITFADLEEATGLSRGAILYHFKTKEQIFSEVSSKFITNDENKLPAIDMHKSLWENIENFVSIKKRQQDFFTSIGIININRAYIHIAINAMTFSQEILDNVLLRREREIVYWKTLLSMAIEDGEIKKELDVELYTQLFLDIFYGYSYTCMMLPNGIDIDFLLKQFKQLYACIAND